MKSFLTFFLESASDEIRNAIDRIRLAQSIIKSKSVPTELAKEEPSKHTITLELPDPSNPDFTKTKEFSPDFKKAVKSFRTKGYRGNEFTFYFNRIQGGHADAVKILQSIPTSDITKLTSANGSHLTSGNLLRVLIFVDDNKVVWLFAFGPTYLHEEVCKMIDAVKIEGFKGRCFRAYNDLYLLTKGETVPSFWCLPLILEGLNVRSNAFKMHIDILEAQKDLKKVLGIDAKSIITEN